MRSINLPRLIVILGLAVLLVVLLQGIMAISFAISSNYNASVAADVTSDTCDTDEINIVSDAGLLGLLPEIGVIYHEALTSPYEEVQGEITSPGIAAYYDELINSCNLVD